MHYEGAVHVSLSTDELSHARLRYMESLKTTLTETNWHKVTDVPDVRALRIHSIERLSVSHSSLLLARWILTMCHICVVVMATACRTPASVLVTGCHNFCDLPW